MIESHPPAVKGYPLSARGRKGLRPVAAPGKITAKAADRSMPKQGRNKVRLVILRTANDLYWQCLLQTAVKPMSALRENQVSALQRW
jgi:hypothetical protein